MTENGDSLQDRYTQDRTPWMAHSAGEAPDSAAHDVQAVALGIVVLLVIFILSSWVPA